MLKDKKAYILFLLPMLLIFAFVTIYPLFYELYLSFRQYNPTRPWYPSEWVGMRNYLEIITDPDFWNSLRITLVFVVVAVTIEFFLGLGIALLFGKDDKSRSKYAVRTLIMGSMVLPPVSVGMLWRYLLNDSFGALAVWLKNIGLNFAWYGSVHTALPTMIFIDVWQWTPFVFLILLAGIVSLPSDVYEAAQIDGASKWRMFIKLTLPLLRPVIIIAILLRMLEAFKIFDMIWVLTRGGPVRATEVIGVRVYLQGFKFFNQGYSAALAIMLLAVSIGLTIAFIRISKFEI
ncbi:MAG: sugar ABC transporter permease [Spirochaetota bacterium]|nr:MAG: sugar ABC transporter permease [Spirochaetota bacterium]